MSEDVKYIERCVDVIRTDKDISVETIIIMFLNYKALVINEYIKEENKK